MRKLALGAVLFAVLGADPADAQRRSFEQPELRQLVTFRWAERMPSNFRPSMATLADIYRQTPAVVRMRGFRKAESPEPFDLILMTSYRGFDGLELARKQMTSVRTTEGRNIFSVQEMLDSTGAWRRDEFVEMLGDLEHRSGSEPRTLIFEWVRLVPAAQRAYELLLQTSVVPWERDLTWLQLSETGRVIVGDGWDYLRILGFASLSEYQDYVTGWRERSEFDQLALHVANRKVFIVTEDEALRVK